MNSKRNTGRKCFKMTIAVLVAGLATCLGPMAAVAHAANATNDRMPLVHVGSNPCECTTIPGDNSGTVVVHSNLTQTRFTINVSVHDALPNTLYSVNQRCVGQIGILTTNPRGVGSSQIELDNVSAPAGPFYIDISVPPPGGDGCGGYGDTYIAGPLSLD